MFDPEKYVCSYVHLCFSLNLVSSETERDWDRDLAEDVKGECEDKYGRVEFIMVERDSEVCSSLNAFHNIV